VSPATVETNATALSSIDNAEPDSHAKVFRFSAENSVAFFADIPLDSAGPFDFFVSNISRWAVTRVFLSDGGCMRHGGRSMIRLFTIAAGVGAIAMTAGSASAVIVGGDGAGRNTSAPTGDLAGSGWQYEGQFGAFLGTAIAPHYFITASHVGGSVGEPFTYNGQSYATTALFDDPASDLRIWKVDGTLGTYAPLDTTGGPAAGQQIVVNGRGTQRGDAIVTSTGQTAGWRWGAADGAQSWGASTVAGTTDRGPGIGTLLRATFDGTNATVSAGDSGGGVFLNDHGAWRLAGVNYAVESQGMVDGQDISGAALVGQSLYASGIAANQAWIHSVIGDVPSAVSNPVPTVPAVPEPASIGLAAIGLVTAAGLRRRRRR
jgi:hypothetical protein